MKNWLKAVGVILFYIFVASFFDYLFTKDINIGFIGYVIACIVGIDFYKDQFDSGKHFYED